MPTCQRSSRRVGAGAQFQRVSFDTDSAPWNHDRSGTTGTALNTSFANPAVAARTVVSPIINIVREIGIAGSGPDDVKPPRYITSRKVAKRSITPLEMTTLALVTSRLLILIGFVKRRIGSVSPVVLTLAVGAKVRLARIPEAEFTGLP